MRILLVILLFLSCLEAKVLKLSEAFLNTYSYNSSGIYLRFKLANKIHLYEKELKVVLGKKDITQLLNYPQTVLYDGKKSFINSLTLFIPKPLLQSSLGPSKARLTIYYQGCSEDGFCYLPSKLYYEVYKKGEDYALTKLKKPKKRKIISEEEQISQDLQEKSLILNLASFFVYGLLLSLTPCILPMIPILSALIASKMGAGKKYIFMTSLIYVLSMSLAYALIGVLVSLVGINIQGLLQKPLVLISFAILFVILSLSMFGLFSLQLPSRCQTWLDKKSQGSGLLGVAVMGFLSALIVGPCIAPPLAGALIYITQSKDVFLGASSLFTMGFGMGIPLLFIGLGGKFIKPGAWMEKVKIFFGFLLLFMAAWLLSRVLDEEITMALYGLIGIFFVVFMGLFDTQKNLLALLKKGVLLCLLSLCAALFANPFLGFLGLKSKPVLVNPSNFTKQIRSKAQLESLLKQNLTKPVLLYYTASWCASCKLLKPYFKKANLNTYNFYVVDLSKNTDEDLVLMKQYKIFGPPALVFIKDGKEYKGLSGFDAIKDFLLSL